MTWMMNDMMIWWYNDMAPCDNLISIIFIWLQLFKVFWKFSAEKVPSYSDDDGDNSNDVDDDMCTLFRHPK